VHQEPLAFFKQLLPRFKVLHLCKKIRSLNIFRNWWLFRGASGLPQFDPRGRNLQIMKFSHNLVLWVGTWFCCLTLLKYIAALHKAIRKTLKVEKFSFVLPFAKINQNFVLITRMFKILWCIHLCGQILSLGGTASDVADGLSYICWITSPWSR